MDFGTLVALALAGALASPIGGAIAIWRKPTSLGLSLAVGFAAGALLGAFAFELMPRAAELASLGMATGGFAAGFAAIYGYDLFLERGASAGEKASQRGWVAAVRRRRHAYGDEVTVLAGGTSAEEVIEGITIGVSAATEPSVGMIVALAIVIDNVSEALSIGDLIREKAHGRQAKRILFWTGLIGISLFTSTIAGWFLLRDVADDLLGLLLAAGGGAMLYLTVTKLVPEAQSHQFQQSSALATGAGVLTIFVLAQLA